MAKLGGSKAVVTGAGSGIGQAVARALVTRGASVVLADIDGEAVARLAGELGAAATPLRLDVTDHAAVDLSVRLAQADHRGAGLTLPLVVLGKQLAHIEGAGGCEGLVRGLRDGQRSARAELDAISLLTEGSGDITLECEPRVVVAGRQRLRAAGSRGSCRQPFRPLQARCRHSPRRA